MAATGWLALKTAKPVSKISNNELTLKLAELKEWQKTIRFAIGAVVSILLALIAAFTAIRIYKTPWTSVLELIGVILAPSALVLWMRKRLLEMFRRYMKADHQRILELEGKLDKNRESSGLNKDGSHPDDD